MSWRALFERSELVRPPQGWRPSPLIDLRRGVNGFGNFCRNKRASPAGAKPGNIENQVDSSVEETSTRRSLLKGFFWQRQRWIPDTQGHAVRPKF